MEASPSISPITATLERYYTHSGARTVRQRSLRLAASLSRLRLFIGYRSGLPFWCGLIQVYVGAVAAGATWMRRVPEYPVPSDALAWLTPFCRTVALRVPTLSTTVVAASLFCSTHRQVGQRHSAVIRSTLSRLALRLCVSFCSSPLSVSFLCFSSFQ